MKDFRIADVESILCTLDEKGLLFPQFELAKENNELHCLGIGSYAYVYEMFNKSRTEKRYALKVIGLNQLTLSKEGFRDANRIQSLLSGDSDYIVRILATKELRVFLDDQGSVLETESVEQSLQESYIEELNGVRLQFILMEKLENVIEIDRFRNVSLFRKELEKPEEVLKFALEVGQAILCVHANHCLHRDIKLENIFWDASEEIYKLGDFGVAKDLEDGNASTKLGTKGYVAPEIGQALDVAYDVTADIYSFGITLYLLLNDLKFPGSNDYSSNEAVQYNPNYVMTAPMHAPKELARIIRKMCRYKKEERYQSMSDVLYDLVQVAQIDENAFPDEMEIPDIQTVLYTEVKTQIQDIEESKLYALSRAERKALQKRDDKKYAFGCVKCLALVMFLIPLLCKGMQQDSYNAIHYPFIISSYLLVFDSVFQREKIWDWVCGVLILGLIMWSVIDAGTFVIPHLLIILCVIIGNPVITLAGGLGLGIWIYTELCFPYAFIKALDNLYYTDKGWIFIPAILLVLYKYLKEQEYYKKISKFKLKIFSEIYDYLSWLLILEGVIILLLRKLQLIVLPDIISRMHSLPAGIVLLVGIMCIKTWHRFFYRTNQVAIGEET